MVCSRGAPEDVCYVLDTIFRRAEVGWETRVGVNNTKPGPQMVLMWDVEKLFNRIGFALTTRVFQRWGYGPKLSGAVRATMEQMMIRFVTAYGPIDYMRPPAGGAQPVLASPRQSSPVLASPRQSSPVLAGPRQSSPVLAGQGGGMA